MAEIVTILVLLILGILSICSVLPFIPSGLISSITVLLYWRYTGYTEPGLIVLITLVILGLSVEILDFASGAIAGKIGGASNRSVIIGSIIGIILTFLISPIGFIIGIGSVVFFYSYYKSNDSKEVAFKKSLYTVIGVLASKGVQVSILVMLTITFGVFVL